jgi:hypothetical protein
MLNDNTYASHRAATLYTLERRRYDHDVDDDVDYDDDRGYDDNDDYDDDYDHD